MRLAHRAGAARAATVMLALPLLATPPAATAGYGAYLNGYGIQSSGAGGVGFATAQDTYSLAANPALAASLGKRVDVGLEWDEVDPGSRIRGNALGPDEEYHSSKTHFPIPMAGVAWPVGERLHLGASGFVAGTGAVYHDSPLTRFGGAPNISLLLGQSGISSGLTYAIQPGRHWVAAASNLSYQVLNIRGAEAFTASSDSPDRVTNRGNDGSFGAGFTLAYYGHPAPWLELGLSYRSKTWSQRSTEYEGLLPQQGSFDLPVIYGGGIAVKPRADLKLAFDYQRALYADEAALGNPLEQLTVEQQPLGSDEGPGFGWRNQNIYKFGLFYRATPTLQLRAGMSQASALIPRSQTLFSTLSPSTNRRHYTLGASYSVDARWEVSGFFAKALRERVEGQNSIPDDFGGGEADIEVRAYSGGVSLTRRF